MLSFFAGVCLPDVGIFRRMLKPFMRLGINVLRLQITSSQMLMPNEGSAYIFDVVMAL